MKTERKEKQTQRREKGDEQMERIEARMKNLEKIRYGIFWRRRFLIMGPGPLFGLDSF